MLEALLALSDLLLFPLPHFDSLPFYFFLHVSKRLLPVLTIGNRVRSLRVVDTPSRLGLHLGRIDIIFFEIVESRYSSHLDLPFADFICKAPKSRSHLSIDYL